MLAVDVPFFMSEDDVIGRAKEKIPEQYYDRTWITSGTVLENALDIPTDSKNAFVLVLDTQRGIVVQVSGEPTEGRLTAVESAARSSMN